MKLSSPWLRRKCSKNTVMVLFMTVYNVEKAIETAKQDDIDLILMDIDLGRNSIGRNTTVISTALH